MVTGRHPDTLQEIVDGRDLHGVPVERGGPVAIEGVSHHEHRWSFGLHLDPRILAADRLISGHSHPG